MTCEFIPSLRDADICKTCGASFFDHKQRKPGKGRKRELTPEQEIALLAWHKSCRTVRQKAIELGVATQTIYNCIYRLDPSRRSAK